jgi:transposase
VPELAKRHGIHPNQIYGWKKQVLDNVASLFARGASALAASFVEDLGEPGNHLSIDRVILGVPSGRLSEATNPLRIDDPKRETAKLYTKIGQLTVERDFLARRPGR